MDSKAVYISLPSMPVVTLSFLSSQVASLIQTYKDHELYFTGMIPIVLWCMYARSYVDMGLPLPRFEFLSTVASGFTYPNNIRIYIETTIVVVISYVSLLMVNWSYIWLVVFPVIAIGFIVALCNELNRQSGSQHTAQSNDGSAGKQADGLEAVALVPYWAVCLMGQLFSADKFAVSRFLLFFSIMLGALTLMMTRLALIMANHGMAPASELLRKASLLALLVAVHAVAAELLGDNVVLFCLPEIAPVLLWFSVHLGRDNDEGAIITADKIFSFVRNNVLILLGSAPAAVLAILAVYIYFDESSVLYWCTKALVSCGVSGLLIYYLVFMLWQWPGPDGSANRFAKDTVEVLLLWAKVLLKVATTLLVIISVWLGLQEPMVAASASQIRGRVFENFLEIAI